MDVRFDVGPDGGELVTPGRRGVTDEIRSEVAGPGGLARCRLAQRPCGPSGPPACLCQGPRAGGRRAGYGHRRLPGADLKIFLTASPEERALRRYKQLKDKGSAVSLAALSREITERDLRDSTRAVAPLKPAPDAEVIDSTGSHDRAGRRSRPGFGRAARSLGVRGVDSVRHGRDARPVINCLGRRWMRSSTCTAHDPCE